MHNKLNSTITTLIRSACIILMLTACEAQLALDGVANTLSKSTLRTDQYQVLLAAADQTILMGSGGLVLVSNDNGSNWQRSIVAKDANFVSAHICPDKTLVAISFDKRLWISTDQAQSWTSNDIPSTEDFQKIHCAPDNTLWLGGSFTTLLSSKDHGANWSEHSLNEDALLTHVQFFSADTGIAVGEFGFFFRTSDGGISWQQGGSIGDEFYPIDAWFQSEQRGWAVGLNGVIHHTSDGGENWSRQDAGGVSAPLYDVFGNDASVFAIGDHGTALQLINEQWRQLPAPKTPVHFSTGNILDDNSLLLAGGWGTISKVSVPDA